MARGSQSRPRLLGGYLGWEAHILEARPLGLGIICIST